MGEHSEYPGLTVNSNAPFCFGRMECLDFVGSRGGGGAGGVSLSLLKCIFKTKVNFCV